MSRLVYFDSSGNEIFDDVGQTVGHSVVTTNADRIRAMSDKELAQWLTFMERRILVRNPALEGPALYKDWLDWLRQEVTP